MKNIENTLEKKYASMPVMPDNTFTMSTKKLVNVFYDSDINVDRSCHKIITDSNGRKYAKYGISCALTFCGKLYKINGPTNPSRRYLLLVGLAKQNPADIKTNKKLAYDTAAENAIVDPIMTMYLPEKITQKMFNEVVNPYYEVFPIEMVMKSKELKEKKIAHDTDIYNEYCKYHLVRPEQSSSSGM